MASKRVKRKESPALKKARNNAYAKALHQTQKEKANLEMEHETLKLEHGYVSKENQVLKRELNMHKAREAKRKKGAKK